MTQALLKKSLAKWRKNQQAETRGQLRLGAPSCPLCIAYNKRTGCDGCPIAEATGASFCMETPYASVEYIARYQSVPVGFPPDRLPVIDELREAIDREVVFLASLVEAQ